MLHTATLDTWWAELYPRIVADLGLDAGEDDAAAFLLDRLLAARDAPRLRPADLKLAGTVLVAGDAPRLAAELRAAPPLPGEHVVVADAALAQVLDAGHDVALVVTDLDGDPARVAAINAEGVPLAVHAHGDNMELLARWVPRLGGGVLGTRQTTGKEPAGVVSPGGFTDGDRAVLLAARLGATRIRLAGFDLSGEPGPGTKDPARKRRKLRWAERILHDARQLGIPLDES